MILSIDGMTIARKLIAIVAVLLICSASTSAEKKCPRFSWDTVPQWDFYRATNDGQILSGLRAPEEGWEYTWQFEHASVWVDIKNEKAKIDWQ